jgi:hypothetical protein
MLKHCAANRKRLLSALPNLSPCRYDVKISGFTRSSIYIYDIVRLRVKLSTHSTRTRTYALTSLPMPVVYIDQLPYIFSNWSGNAKTRYELLCRSSVNPFAYTVVCETTELARSVNTETSVRRLSLIGRLIQRRL